MDQDAIRLGIGYVRMKRVTLQDLAEAAGLSRSTVSRALRNHPAIAPDTIRRVGEIACELGYQPDARVSDLMFHLRRSKEVRDRPVLAMIIQKEKPHRIELGAEGQQGVISGVIRRAESQGYQVEPFFIQPGDHVESSLSRIIWARGIRGVIIASLQKPQFQFSLQWDRFCLVAIGYALQAPELHRAVSHQYQTFTETVKQLLGLGYRRLGCAMPDYIDRRTNYIYRGAFYAMREKYESGTLIPLHRFNYEDPQSFLQWYRRYKPDAIIGAGAHDHMVLPWLQKAGIRCPQDVGYASVHLTRFDGSVSGVTQNSDQVGAAAVDLLVNAMRHNERGIPKIAHTVLIHGTWINGQTTLATNSKVGDAIERDALRVFRP